ncbi:hypothetical protein D3C73_1049240 [compost metagenome]
MVHHLIELVGEGLSDQLMGNQVGHGGIEWDQWLLEVADIKVVHLLHQTVRQVGFIQQAVQAHVPLHHARRLQEIGFGDLQYRFDLRLDTGLERHRVGSLQQLRHLVDIGADEARQSTLGVLLRQLDRGVQMGQLQLETLFQLAGMAFVIVGLAYLLAYSSDVHDNSRDNTFQTEDTKLARYTEYLRRICYKSRKRVRCWIYADATIMPLSV